MPVRITIVEYDDAWPAKYEAEAELLRVALGPVATRIDHVGSTSVPGLGAKPIIDINVSVATLLPMEPYREPLERAGYVYVEDVNDNGVDELPFFPKPATEPRAFHVHIVEADTYNERRHLLFRDWLRTHPDDRAAYERHKRDLATREWGRGQDYADAKTDFITTIVDQATNSAR